MKKNRRAFYESEYDDYPEMLSSSKEAVDMAFPDVRENVRDIIADWYDAEAAYEDFSEVGEFADYIKEDIADMLDAADYPERDIVGMSLAKCGYVSDVFGPEYYPDDESYPYYNELTKYGLTESCNRRSNLREAVKKTSLNALIAEIMKGQPPKPIKRPGDAAKWFKDLAKDNSFVTEQVCGFIKSKKLDLAIDFLENIKYMSTITESEATRLVKKYGKGETKKYPLANEVKESRYLGEKFLNEGDVVIEILQDDGKWYPVGTTREGWSISKDVRVRVFESLAEAKRSALRRALDNDGYHEDLGNLRFTKKDDGLENL